MTLKELENIVDERFEELEDAIVFRLKDLEMRKYDKNVKYLLFEVFLDPEKTNISIMLNTLDESKNDTAKATEFVKFKFYRKKLTDELFELGLDKIIHDKFFDWFDNCWHQTNNVALNIKSFLMFHDSQMYELETNTK